MHLTHHSFERGGSQLLTSATVIWHLRHRRYLVRIHCGTIIDLHYGYRG